MSARSAASGTRSGSASAAASASLARLSISAGRSSMSDDNIDASLALHHVITFELEARIGCAFAGTQLVFPAVPGAHDVRIIVVVGLPDIRLIRSEQLDHLALHHALAGGAALMQAVVAVGIVGTSVPVDADLEPVLTHDADVAIAHLNILANENLRHSSPAPGLRFLAYVSWLTFPLEPHSSPQCRGGPSVGGTSAGGAGAASHRSAADGQGALTAPRRPASTPPTASAAAMPATQSAQPKLLKIFPSRALP